jgi:hypothetical protein
MAWIDADIEFENSNWVMETIRSLQSYDILQLFSHCDDLGITGKILKTDTSFMYRCITQHYLDFHSGYAWAMTRKAFEQMNGLFEYGIIGSGDRCMALAFVGCIELIQEKLSPFMYQELEAFEKRCQHLKVSYLKNSVIRHHYHGKKKNRLYNERYKCLLEYNYHPQYMLQRQDNGIFTLNPDTFPEPLRQSIESYFFQRKEDDDQ